MKKWTYLAVAGMLLGSAPVFTGCVDTDEPWGVSPDVLTQTSLGALSNCAAQRLNC